MRTSPQPEVLTLAEALFNESADALFLLDPETDRLLDVNPVALRLSGFDREGLLRLPASALFRSEHAGGREQLRGAAARTGIFHARDGYLLRTSRDGAWVPVSLSISRLHVRPRTLALVTARDVREQREAYARLERLQAELGRLTASIAACLWSAEVDRQGRWQYRHWSPVVERVTGRAPGYFAEGPDRWGSVVHPDDRASWRGALAGWRQGRSGEHEYRVVRPDGAVRWVREEVTAARADAGLRLDAVVADVTERRRAEGALEEQRAFLQQLIAHIPCAVFWKDRRSVYLGCNEQSARDLGLGSPEGAVGKTDHELPFGRDEADFYVRCDREVMESGRPLVNIEETQHRPGGGQAVLLTSKAPLRGANGEVVGVLGVYTDITQRKRTEEQLAQSQKMEAVGRLAGGVAHDFNNLLTVINGYGELVLGLLPAGHPARPAVEQMTRAGERAAELTRRLLGFSRRQVVAPRVLDLNAVLLDLERMLRRLIGEDVELAVVPGPAPCRVRADPGQLEQVVVNLAVNARDAMPRGGRLTVEAACVELSAGDVRGWPGVSPGPFVLLTVADTGVGMDPATLGRVFEPFFTTKGERGTGLGLATVWGVIHQSGGHVAVSSERGRGTVFRVYLPRAAEEGSAGPAGAAGPPPRGGETVLLVEDDDALRALAQHTLEECGYRVVSAGGGEEGLAAGQRDPGVELLVTDVVMPRMGGRELAERLRKGRPGIKVLYMSGYTDDAVLRHGVREAQAPFLQKPFTPSDLARKVRQVLDG